MVSYGTSHFVDMAAAVAYYCGERITYRRSFRDENNRVKTIRRTVVRGGMGYKPEDVQIMLNDGTIHLGTPELPTGAKLCVIPGEGRYEIAIPNPVAA